MVARWNTRSPSRPARRSIASAANTAASWPRGDTPYADRALPPQNLDDFDPAFTCNYHLYRVLKPVTAETGPVAPGFGQPGWGLQYQLIGSLLPGAPATANVMWLISNGYLRRLN